jgi:hypothetical protein
MRDDILEKLSKFLKNPIEQECGVVYLMVEMRKLIEHKRNELDKSEGFQHYPGIAFYSNWCVHTELDGCVAQDYLKQIEAMSKRGEIKDEMFSFLKFEGLKLELANFFKEYGLDETVFFTNWESFKGMLIDVLADSPLLIKEPKKGQIKRFHFDKRVERGRSVSCDIEYEIEEDGGKYSATVGIIE